MKQSIRVSEGNDSSQCVMPMHKTAIYDERTTETVCVWLVLRLARSLRGKVTWGICSNSTESASIPASAVRPYSKTSAPTQAAGELNFYNETVRSLMIQILLSYDRQLEKESCIIMQVKGGGGSQHEDLLRLGQLTC